MNTPLDKKADLKTIRMFYQDGFLNEEAFRAAEAIMRPSVEWFIWARQLLLFIGSALVLSGIIFFFAYNWDKMGRFFKLGLLEGLILACAVGSQWWRHKKLEAKVLLLSAAVLVGVLMAVYGQIYQTGADAFELFVGWAALIFGWVVVSEFAALWFVWLAILNTGLILYWVQVGQPSYKISYDYLWLSLAGLNASALVLREIGLKFALEWVRSRWLRPVLFLAMIIALSIPTTLFIVDYEHVHETAAIAAVIWMIVAATGYWLYRIQWPDIIILGLIIMNACYLVIILICKLLFENIEHHNAGLFLFIALIILAIVSAAAFWLKILMKKMTKPSKEGLYEN
jgi:uncharacterized membrane protein